MHLKTIENGFTESVYSIHKIYLVVYHIAVDKVMPEGQNSAILYSL
jgi:hypothetical protein